MKNDKRNVIILGWTTVSSKEDGQEIIRKLFDLKLISCGEIEGPITSIYTWKGEVVEEMEWRITLKFPISSLQGINQKIVQIHPYDIPQWIYREVDGSKEFTDWVSAQ